MAEEEIFYKLVFKHGLARSPGHLTLLKYPDGSVKVSFLESIYSEARTRLIEFSTSNIERTRATFYGDTKSIVTLDVPSIPTGKIAFDFHYDDDNVKSQTSAKEFVKTLTQFLPGKAAVSVCDSSKMAKKPSANIPPRQLLTSVATGKAKCTKCNDGIPKGAIRFGKGRTSQDVITRLHSFDAGSYCGKCIKELVERARDLKDCQANRRRIYPDKTLDKGALELIEKLECANTLGEDFPNLLQQVARYRCKPDDSRPAAAALAPSVHRGDKRRESTETMPAAKRPRVICDVKLEDIAEVLRVKGDMGIKDLVAEFYSHLPTDAQKDAFVDMVKENCTFHTSASGCTVIRMKERPVKPPTPQPEPQSKPPEPQPRPGLLPCRPAPGCCPVMPDDEEDPHMDLEPPPQPAPPPPQPAPPPPKPAPPPQQHAAAAAKQQVCDSYKVRSTRLSRNGITRDWTEEDQAVLNKLDRAAWLRALNKPEMTDPCSFMANIPQKNSREDIQRLLTKTPLDIFGIYQYLGHPIFVASLLESQTVGIVEVAVFWVNTCLFEQRCNTYAAQCRGYFVTIYSRSNDSRPTCWEDAKACLLKDDNFGHSLQRWMMERVEDKIKAHWLSVRAEFIHFNAKAMVKLNRNRLVTSVKDLICPGSGDEHFYGLALSTEAQHQRAAFLKWSKMPNTLQTSPALTYPMHSIHLTDSNMEHRVRTLSEETRKKILVRGMEGWPDYDRLMDSGKYASICEAPDCVGTTIPTARLEMWAANFVQFTNGATACEILALLELANICYIVSSLMYELEQTRRWSSSELGYESNGSKLRRELDTLSSTRYGCLMWLFQTEDSYYGKEFDQRLASSDGWNRKLVPEDCERAFTKRYSALRARLYELTNLFTRERLNEIVLRGKEMAALTGAGSSNDTPDSDVTISHTSRRDEWYKDQEITKLAIVLE